MAEYKGVHTCEECKREYEYSLMTSDKWETRIPTVVQVDGKNWAAITSPRKDGLPEYSLKMRCPRNECDHLNSWTHKVR